MEDCTFVSEYGPFVGAEADVETGGQGLIDQYVVADLAEEEGVTCEVQFGDGDMSEAEGGNTVEKRDHWAGREQPGEQGGDGGEDIEQNTAHDSL